MQAEVDLPMATLGERLVTRDVVVKGRTKAADLHPELVASWPSGASWPPAPEVAADRIRVRRIRRIAAVVALRGRPGRPALGGHRAAAHPPAPHRAVPARRRGAGGRGAGGHRRHRHDHAVAGRAQGQRRSWFVAVALLTATLVLHIAHGADVISLLSAPAVLVLLSSSGAVPGPDRAGHHRSAPS